MNLKNRLPVMPFLALFVTIALFPSHPASGAETTGVEIIPTDNVTAYVIDENPAGVSVRSGPDMKYPVIATLPTDPGVTVHVLITGSAGEWIRISEPDITKDGGESKILNIVGWVTGPVLGMRADIYGSIGAVVPLYEEPSTKSPILTRLQYNAGVAIIGCRGEWMKANYKGVEGWLEPGTYCGAAFTTCP